MRRRRIPCIICLLFLPMFASCSQQDPSRPAERASLPKMVIGLPPERNIFRQIERHEPLMAYLGKKAGVRFELKVFPRYANIVNDFKSMELDGGFFGSLTYAVAHSRLDLTIIARPESPKGISTYHAMIFVRKDSGIGSVRDMKGKRMALVDMATTAGCLLPRVYFSEHGISDYKKILKEAYYAGTHEDVIHDVVDGKADIGAAKNTILERMVAENRPRIDGAVKVLSVSPDVPESGLALRSDIGEGMISKIRKVLLTMDQDPEGRRILEDFGARRFIETTDEDYEPVYRYAKKAGIDPAKLGCLKEQR